ncbi:MAG: (E)-4-hydroxy-3-methylbut-2-enyl-diphosphate synthase [Bacteroidales bacterium]|nr:(E)-4-hydroxy-3-methylbut-2-enyl-diphosphate synthase [Bacteroidales bacterium]
MFTRKVQIGNVTVGGGSPVAVQTMCNTHTADVDATLDQCRRLAAAGADIIRLTVPGPKEVEAIREIRSRLRAEGIGVPLVADIHFSARTALDVAPFVEKVRINPGNFHPDHAVACARFAELLEVCRAHGTAIRIGLNHGSLGARITERYGNTPEGMCAAAMEWIEMCIAAEFYQVVVSLKASNTRVMVDAYRLLAEAMEKRGVVFPLHVGVTEAGNGDSGRIKSCVGISALLSRGIGDTLRVSLTEDPAHEIPVGRYLADRYGRKTASTLKTLSLEGRRAVARYEAPSRERVLLDFACDFGARLLDRELDEVVLDSGFGAEYDRYLTDELMQATRRVFYKPEYIACPGCGRTMYDLEEAFAQVKARTSHLKGMVIAVMGCIVNGPGEMADADWGYVGEGDHKVSIYRRSEPVLRHVPDTEAVDRLVELIEQEKSEN